MERGHGQDGVSSTNCLRAGFGQPEVLDLALLNQLFDCAGHFLDGHVRVNAMLVKQINRLDFEPVERSLNHSFDAFGLAGHTPLLAAVAIESELRGNDYLPMERSECFADYEFS